jgi:hypothetical protein
MAKNFLYVHRFLRQNHSYSVVNTDRTLLHRYLNPTTPTPFWTQLPLPFLSFILYINKICIQNTYPEWAAVEGGGCGGGGGGGADGHLAHVPHVPQQGAHHLITHISALIACLFKLLFALSWNS